MPETYTFVVPVWCVILLVASQLVATGFTLWRTLWLRRQVRLIEAAERPEPEQYIADLGVINPLASDDSEGAGS